MKTNKELTTVLVIIAILVAIAVAVKSHQQAVTPAHKTTDLKIDHLPMTKPIIKMEVIVKNPAPPPVKAEEIVIKQAYIEPEPVGAPNLKIIGAEQVKGPRDGMVSVAVEVMNAGTKNIPAGAWIGVQQALRPDQKFEAIMKQGKLDFPLGFKSFGEGLQQGEKRTIFVNGTLRDDYPKAGYIWLMVDYLNGVAESDETDNVIAIEYHPPDKTTAMNAAAK